jgi:hypothetical protein
MNQTFLATQRVLTINGGGVFFRGSGPWEDAGRLVLKKSRPISFGAPLGLAYRAFVSPIPSLGRNKQALEPLFPQQASGLAESPASHFFSSILAADMHVKKKGRQIQIVSFSS